MEPQPARFTNTPPTTGNVVLWLQGTPVAMGTVDRIHADGMHIRGVLPQLATGTYLEIDLIQHSLGLVGAMVSQRTPQGMSLLFASWSPQLFDMIHRLARSSELGIAVVAKASQLGRDDLR